MLLGGLLTIGRLHASEEADSPAIRHANSAYPDKVALVIAEALPDRNIADPQVLASYGMVNGKVNHREEILTTPDKEVRFDMGRSRIFHNRYAATHWGDVVDIQKHSVIHDSKGEVLVDREGGSLILYRSNDRGFYSFDLHTQQHRTLEDPGKWALLLKGLGLSDVGVLSPDGTRAVVEGVPEVSEKTKRLTSIGGRLSLCTLDGQTKKLAESFGNELSIRASFFGQIPVLWLDNERVLTQKSNGKLVILKMEGIVEPAVNFAVPTVPLIPSSLSRDPEGRIIYQCGESYVIDVDKQQSTRLEWVNLGHGFQCEPDKWPVTEMAIRYQGREIGRGIFDGTTARTIAGHLAISPVRTEKGWPRQVHVWNAHTNTWLVLPLGGPLIEIVGWTENFPKEPSHCWRTEGHGAGSRVMAHGAGSWGRVTWGRVRPRI